MRPKEAEKKESKERRRAKKRPFSRNPRHHQRWLHARHPRSAAQRDSIPDRPLQRSILRCF